MTIIVGNTERSELNAAVARARAHPVPWEVLVGSVSRTSRINRSQMSPRRLNSSICPSAMSSPSTSKSNRRGRACTYRFRVRGRESRRIWSSAR
jgi:hypothetical protein